MWSEVSLGKYQGKTLPWIVLHDPDWFFWAYEKRLFGTTGLLASEAMEVLVKSNNIKIPKTDAENWRVDYLWDIYREFSKFRIIEKAHADRWGEIAFRKDCIDLSAARYIFHRFSQYEAIKFERNRRDILAARQLKECKRDGWCLLKQFKHLYFGSGQFRLTKKRCEQFFDNPANFIDRLDSPELDIPRPPPEDDEAIIESIIDSLAADKPFGFFKEIPGGESAWRAALRTEIVGDTEHETDEKEPAASLEEFL